VLRIQAPAGNRILGVSGSIEVTVQLPAGSRVEAKAATAEFRTVGRLGDVSLDSPHATVKIAEAVGGTLVLRTEDGAISVDAPAGVSAILDAGTSYGRIRNALRNTEVAAELNIHATTGRGDITARSL
jgi:hypothetical protein